MAASDDEQIRRINFQHNLEMAHKEKKQGFFPDQSNDDPLADTIVNTNPQPLGLSLLTNTVNTIVNMPTRSEEVTLSPYKPV
jgi:hypothetical protein